MRFVSLVFVFLVVVVIDVTTCLTLDRPSKTHASVFGTYIKRVASYFGKERRTAISVTGNYKRDDISFECDSYFSVSNSLTKTPSRDVIRAMRDIFLDNLITQDELKNVTKVICQSLSDDADSLEEEYSGCPNQATINESMQHLGPMCLRSGALSTFATNLLTNFTEVTTTARCNSYVIIATLSCRVKGNLVFESTGYAEDLANVKRIVKERYNCAFRNMTNAHECGDTNDLKRAYLLIGSPLIMKPGLVYNMEDFF